MTISLSGMAYFACSKFVVRYGFFDSRACFGIVCFYLPNDIKVLLDSAQRQPSGFLILTFRLDTVVITKTAFALTRNFGTSSWYPP